MSKQGSPDLRDASSEGQSARDAASADGERTRRVLVVDDNRDAAEMLRMILEMQGHEVHVAHDGSGALAALERFAPDVALLDIGLPGMDGYELARRLREDARSRTAYLIALTGWGQLEDRARSLEAGFDAHVTKPANPELVQRLVSSAP